LRCNTSDRIATTLLPGLLEVLQRNVSRGFTDLALYHIGQVAIAAESAAPAPEIGVSGRPTEAELAALAAAIPEQHVHIAAVLAGNRQRPGWWGKGEPASWSDAIQAARIVGETSGLDLVVRAADHAPWHPGRCAELRHGDVVVGHAGELHPKVVEALGLPRRTCAMELNLDAIPVTETHPVPVVSPYPPVLLDVALVVDTAVPSAEVTEVLRTGSGELLEHLALFDVYTGQQLGDGKRSLAYSLRFRAPDRTLTREEATAARDAAVTLAAERFGAALRA
jgi:phenylalanyl-tRNA synthetase beta chain